MGLFLANEQVLYAVVDSSTGDFTWLRYGRSYDPDGDAPVPQAEDGLLLVEMDKPDLEGLTERQFLNQKKAVITNGEFSHWIEKNLPHQLSVDGNPKADMSNAPTVSVTGGSPDQQVEVHFSRPVDCSLPEKGGSPGVCLLDLDGSGEGEFQIRVAGLGPLSLKVCCSGARSSILHLTVESGFSP